MAEVHLDQSKLGEVKGKVAIVTGGASGIGKALVELLHDCGASVVFCDRNVTDGEKLAEHLGSKVDFFKCDVTKWDEMTALFSNAKEKHGHIDFVFANAGITDFYGAFEERFDEEGNLAEPNLDVVDVNLKSVILTAKIALFYFKKNSPAGGSLVLTCSTSGYTGRPNVPVYSATKHGVLGLMRGLRHDPPKDGVTVNCIAPGGTESGMITAKATEAFNALGIPVQKPGRPALAALFLASNSDWNGKTLVVIGSRASEVETSIQETEVQWYGKYNSEMAAKGGKVKP